MLKAGDVILAKVQFTDTYEVKRRPCAVLFVEFGNVVVTGITSNTEMQGIALRKEDGALKDSVIKVNYVFTIAESMAEKVLFHLPRKKKKEVHDALLANVRGLIA